MIELTGRVGANCLPELVEINYGIEYYKMIAAMAVGCNPLEYWEERNSSATAGFAKMILFTDKNGILKDIRYNGEMTEDILEITFFKHSGDEIHIFENSNDCVGQIIVKAENLENCKEIIKHIMEQIYITLE